MRIRVPLSALKAANKPRMIAARLGINVESIYAFRRELRRQVKKMNHGISNGWINRWQERPKQLDFWQQDRLKRNLKQLQENRWLRLMQYQRGTW